MADLSDVEVALVQATLDALYPAGIDQPSCIGSPARVFRGEPVTATLERDLAANVTNISVFSMPNTTRNSTRWSPKSQTRPGAPTLLVEVMEATISFSGVAGIGQVAGVIVDDQAFVYRGVSSDTPAVVAAVLAAAIGASRSCLLAGCTLTVPGAHRLVGRVVADGVSTSEWCRQEQAFCVGCWCPTPQLRDRVASVVQSWLCGRAFLPLADDTSARIRYRSTSSSDVYQAFCLYRRDLTFDVEYGTTATTACPTMLFGDLTWSGATVFT